MFIHLLVYSNGSRRLAIASAAFLCRQLYYTKSMENPLAKVQIFLNFASPAPRHILQYETGKMSADKAGSFPALGGGSTLTEGPAGAACFQSLRTSRLCDSALKTINHIPPRRGFDFPSPTFAKAFAYTKVATDKAAGKWAAFFRWNRPVSFVRRDRLTLRAFAVLEFCTAFFA